MSDPHNSLNIAMQLPDPEVEKPTRKDPTSLTSQIYALEVGQSAFKGLEITYADLKGVAGIKKGLSDSAHSSMRHAAKRRASESPEYTIETAATFTNSGLIYAMAIIKRTA